MSSLASRICRFMAAAMLLPLASCVRDELPECPPLRLHLAVKDKNWFNVDKVEYEQRRSEELPFRDYVSSLWCLLRDAETGAVVERQGPFYITDEAQVLDLTFDSALPYGEYRLTVWGATDHTGSIADNGPMHLFSVDDDGIEFHLHSSGEEGHDIYLTTDPLSYDYDHNDQTFEMERAKGKLIVLAENLPDGYTHAGLEVSNVQGTVDHNFAYGSSTTVSATMPLSDGDVRLASMLLSPSPDEKKSTLRATFNTGTRAEELTPKGINITMRRNELTVVKYVFDAERDDFDIYILINDNWELIRHLIVD